MLIATPHLKRSTSSVCDRGGGMGRDTDKYDVRYARRYVRENFWLVNTLHANRTVSHHQHR